MAITVHDRVFAALDNPHIHPEIAALIDCPQDHRHHPEGDVRTHTVYVYYEARAIAERDRLRGSDYDDLMLAALCHDLGKPATTEVHADGRVTSYGHDIAGEAPTISLLTRLGVDGATIDRVVGLVREHMAHVHMSDVTEKAVRKVRRRLEEHGASLVQLTRLIEADHYGRPPLPRKLGAKECEFVEVALAIAADPPKPEPIVKGRDLIAAGLVEPGPAVGLLLARLAEYEAAGTYTTVDGGLIVARELLA